MISVIIPCYNCVSFVKKSIESVLSQTFQDYELLLIDNRSTDGTLHILNYYKERYPEKVSVYHENKKGAPAARNNGLLKAKGEWIQFLDADDELLPEKLEHQSNLVKGSAAGIVCGNYIIKAVKANKTLSLNKYVVQDPWKGLITSNLGITSSNLWRRSDLLEVKGWDETLSSSQEYHLLFRLLKKNTGIIFDTSFLTFIHKNHSSISKSTDKKKLTQIVHNRIDLRHRIKEYLVARQQLTRELRIMIDTYIYFELKRNSGFIPEYADQFMRQHMLEVPFNFMLKTNARLKLKQWFSFLFL